MAGDDKIRLLKLSQEVILIADMTLSDTIKLHILKNNFCVDDLAVFVRNYQAESQAVQKEILRLCQVHLAMLLAMKCTLAFELLSLLLTDIDIITDNKLQLLIILLY